MGNSPLEDEGAQPGATSPQVDLHGFSHADYHATEGGSCHFLRLALVTDICVHSPATGCWMVVHLQYWQDHIYQHSRLITGRTLTQFVDTTQLEKCISGKCKNLHIMHYAVRITSSQHSSSVDHGNMVWLQIHGSNMGQSLIIECIMINK